jgi:adenylate cyclase
MLPVWLGSTFLVVASEGSDRYVDAAAVTVVGVLVLVYVAILAGVGPSRLVEQWAAGREVDRARALEATYAWARGAVVRTVGASAVLIALLLVVVGAIAGATGSRPAQYGIVGAVASLIVMHSFVEATMRPARIAIAGDTGIGDALPRSRPTFAAWSNVSILAATFSFAVLAAMLAAVFHRASEAPVLAVVIGGALTLGFAPLVVGASFSPSLRPIRDLAEGTERVAAGDYTQRLPVVQDDDLGALAASFNRMQAGLAERQRLQAAFGTTSTPPWRLGCSRRATTSSPGSAVR